MDRLIREGNPPVGQLASPIPQYKRPGLTDYEAVEGQHGAPFAILKDASGNVVSPATDEKLEQVRALLSGVATDAKLEQARVLLDAISTKDFATQTTLAAVLAKLEQLETEITAIKDNQLSGDQKVQLSGTIVEVVKVVDALAITTSASRYIDLPDTTKYRDWDLFVTNTLNEECRVGFTEGSTAGAIFVIDTQGSIVNYNPGHVYGGANYQVNGVLRGTRLSTLPMTTAIPDPAEYKKLSAFIKQIALRAAVAPTEGAITITLVGVL